LAALNGLIVFAISFLIVVATTPITRKYALRWKVGDKPNGRKIHTSTIPHVGGIGIVLGTITSFGFAVWLLGVDTGGSSVIFAGSIVAIGLIVVLGLLDDMKNLGAMQKLAIQAVAASLLAFCGFRLLTGLPGFDSQLVLVIPLTVFYLVGVSSSLNLIDGHDGLAAGVCFISSLAFSLVATLGGASTAVAMSVALMGASIGFLLFNFPPGRIFMGDTGSMFLGIMLGLVACSVTVAKPTLNTFFSVCFILAVPILDSWLAIGRRWALREPVFKADCLHMHHILSTFGFSSRQTLLVLYTLQAVMACIGVLAMIGYVFPIVLGLLFLLLLYVSFFRLMVTSRRGLSAVTTRFAHNSIPSLEE
jgi:UDP-GlcNAc:undecaprenyl-phosphate GlcNAc-1-phosphate transferase